MKWVFDNWIIPIIVSIIVVVLIIFFSIHLWKLIVNWWRRKKNKERLSKNVKKYDVGSYTIDIKIIEINFVRTKDPNNELAWFGLMELMTRVITNSFDENGSVKSVLNSLYALFQDLRNKMIQEVNSTEATIVTLTLLNKILRNFLAKWDKKINYDKKKIKRDKKKELSSEEKTEFTNDYFELKNQIIKQKILEDYGRLCNIDILVTKIKNKQKENIDSTLIGN